MISRISRSGIRAVFELRRTRTDRKELSLCAVLYPAHDIGVQLARRYGVSLDRTRRGVPGIVGHSAADVPEEPVSRAVYRGLHVIEIESFARSRRSRRIRARGSERIARPEFKHGFVALCVERVGVVELLGRPNARHGIGIYAEIYPVSGARIVIVDIVRAGENGSYREVIIAHVKHGIVGISVRAEIVVGISERAEAVGKPVA